MRFRGKHVVSRQDLKEDKFQEFIEKVIAAYYKDRQKFWIGAAVAVLAVIAVILMLQNRGPRMNPQAEIAFTQAVGVFSTGNMEQAEPAFKELAARFGRDFVGLKAHFYLGNIYFNSNKPAEAKQEFTTFYNRVKNDPLLSPASLLGMANCEEQQGNNAAAAALYEQVRKKYPKSPLAFDAAMAAGRCLRNAGTYDKAEALYNELLKDKPVGDRGEKVKTELARVQALKTKFQ
jgi:TolA-binding protein